MKTKFLCMAVITAMALSSCQKDDVTTPGAGEPGQDTYMGMTIQLPKSVVDRADSDANGTVAESKLTTISVGVWSTGDAAITYTNLDVAKLTANNDGTYTATEAIKAKTGSNNVIVIANTATQPTIAQVNGDAFGILATEIAIDNKFVMYSTEITEMANVAFASKAEVEAATDTDPLFTTNRATVTLRRAAAKVSVTSLLDNTTTGIADGQGNGMLTNIVWNIANNNKVMTFFPKYIVPSAFEASNINSPFTRLDLVNPAPTTGLPKKNDPAVVAYCLENAHTGVVYRENNTTAVQVSATFAPNAGKYISDVTGTSAANAVVTFSTADMTAGSTFYVSKAVVGTASIGSFFSADAVDAAVANLGMVKIDSFTEYTNGKCFWPIWINDGELKPTFGVVRNHMYTMNITSIKAPGFPVFPDSDNPIAAETWIMVDLAVDPWNVKGMGDIEL